MFQDVEIPCDTNALPYIVAASVSLAKIRFRTPWDRFFVHEGNHRRRIYHLHVREGGGESGVQMNSWRSR